jgi:hypothetical protein
VGYCVVLGDTLSLHDEKRGVFSGLAECGAGGLGKFGDGGVSSMADSGGSFVSAGETDDWGEKGPLSCIGGSRRLCIGRGEVDDCEPLSVTSDGVMSLTGERSECSDGDDTGL